MIRLDIDRVRKTYPGGKTALEGISFSCGAGVVGLLGPNGAGKTTLVSILAGVLVASEGTMELNGISPLRDSNRWRAQLGFMPQHFDFPPGMTGREVLVRAGLLHRLSPAEARRQACELLRETRLTDAASRRAARYSRGMKQRLGIACALIGNPQLLLLDEPTSGLDPAERVFFRELLAHRGALGETLTILSSHIVEDIERCCDSVVVIDKGRVLFHGALTSLIERAEGIVWELPCTHESVEEWKRAGRLVALRASGERGMRARVVSVAPPGGDAVAAKPTLDDGYLALLAASRQVAPGNGEVDDALHDDRAV